MNEHDERAPGSADDSRSPSLPLAAGEMQTVTVASDRLYQLAALTAGIILLVTLV